MATKQAKKTRVGKQSRIPLRVPFMLLRTPEVLKRIGKGLWRKHVTVNKDYNREDNISKPFQLISIRITNACNHRCAVCGQWGDTGYNRKKDPKELGKTVPVETYIKRIDEVAHYDPMVYITGGEPTLYKGLLPFIQHCKSKKLTVNLVTNGCKLAEMADELVEAGLDEISISFDGPKEIHDECRRVPGAFEEAIKAIQAVQDAKRRLKKRKPYILTIATVSDKNAGLLAEVIEETEPLHPDLMVVYYHWFTSQKKGEEYTKILQKWFDVTPISWHGYVSQFPREHIEELKQSIAKIKSTRYEHPIVFIPDINIDQVDAYYENLDEMFGYNRCINPWIEINIMPNGDVVPCRDQPDVVMGNVQQESLLDMWNNDKYRKFRKLLKEQGGLLPICGRCCGLMGF